MIKWQNNKLFFQIDFSKNGHLMDFEWGILLLIDTKLHL